MERSRGLRSLSVGHAPVNPNHKPDPNLYRFIVKCNYRCTKFKWSLGSTWRKSPASGIVARQQSYTQERGKTRHKSLTGYWTNSTIVLSLYPLHLKLQCNSLSDPERFSDSSEFLNTTRHVWWIAGAYFTYFAVSAAASVVSTLAYSVICSVQGGPKKVNSKCSTHNFVKYWPI